MYYDRETAPMRYYRVLRTLSFVWLFLGAIMYVSSMVKAFTMVDLVFCILHCAGLLVVCCFLGAYKWIAVKALYFVMGLPAANAVVDLIGLILSKEEFGLAVPFAAWMMIMVSLLLILPSAIYFNKRRPLFEPYVGEIVAG